MDEGWVKQREAHCIRVNVDALMVRMGTYSSGRRQTGLIKSMVENTNCRRRQKRRSAAIPCGPLDVAHFGAFLVVLRWQSGASATCGPADACSHDQLPGSSKIQKNDA